MLEVVWLQEFIVANHLKIENKGGVPTFQSSRYSTHIDVTLTNVVTFYFSFLPMAESRRSKRILPSEKIHIFPNCLFFVACAKYMNTW